MHTLSEDSPFNLDLFSIVDVPYLITINMLLLHLSAYMLSCPGRRLCLTQKLVNWRDRPAGAGKKQTPAIIQHEFSFDHVPLVIRLSVNTFYRLSFCVVPVIFVDEKTHIKLHSDVRYSKFSTE
jgi:hypothetical protein